MERKSSDTLQYGRAIRIARAARGWSQKTLAKRLGVAPSYISLLEAGKRSPSTAMLESLAEQFGVPLHVFMLMAAEAGELRGIDVKAAEGLGRQLIDILWAIDREDAGVHRRKR